MTEKQRVSDEWLTGEREHERKMAQIAADRARTALADKNYRREQVTMRVVAVVVGIVVLGLVVGLGLWIHSATQADADRKQTERLACVESGGTAAPIGANGTIICLRGVAQ